MAGKKQRMKDLQQLSQRKQMQAAQKQEMVDKDFLKNNKLWDELNATARQYMFMLRAHAAHSCVARSEEMRAELPDVKLFAICLTGLSRHLQQLGTELQQIHSLHKDFSGGCSSHDEIIIVMEIFERYQTFSERHDAILLPTTQILTNMTTQAEQALVAKGKTAVVDSLRVAMHDFIRGANQPQPNITPEQDPAVVTDIEVK